MTSVGRAPHPPLTVTQQTSPWHHSRIRNLIDPPFLCACVWWPRRRRAPRYPLCARHPRRHRLESRMHRERLHQRLRPVRAHATHPQRPIRSGASCPGWPAPTSASIALINPSSGHSTARLALAQAARRPPRSYNSARRSAHGSSIETPSVAAGIGARKARSGHPSAHDASANSLMIASRSWRTPWRGSTGADASVAARRNAVQVADCRNRGQCMHR